MTHSSPIGIFDSGIGGLSIAREVRSLLPNEHLLYVADSHHAPYGDKTDGAIFERMEAVTAFMVSRGAKAVVVACNTATTSAIDRLRARYDIPIVGVEPGVKPAVLATRSGVVGVLATPRTLQTQSFSALAARFASGVKIEVQPCPDLVARIEALHFDGEETAALLRQYLSPLLEKGADTLVLGCTHYHHLSSLISELAGPDITVISTEAAVAKEVGRRLEAAGLLAIGDDPGCEAFWTSGPLDRFQRQVARLWGGEHEVFSLDACVPC